MEALAVLVREDVGHVSLAVFDEEVAQGHGRIARDGGCGSHDEVMDIHEEMKRSVAATVRSKQK